MGERVKDTRKPLMVRVNTIERQKLKADAKRLNLTVSKYVRRHLALEALK